MCSVIAIQILDAFLFSSGNQDLPQSDQALRGRSGFQLPALDFLQIKLQHASNCKVDTTSYMFFDFDSMLQGEDA